MSAGEQSKARQSASRVEKRTAFALLFLRIERFTGVMPTRSESSLSHNIQIDDDHNCSPSNGQVIFAFDPHRLVDHIFDYTEQKS